MAKRDINKMTGKYAPSFSKQVQEHLQYVFSQMDREEKAKQRAINPPPKKMGNRTIIIETYRKNRSKEEVYQVMNKINEKFGKEVYTREMVDRWINEEFGISNINKKGKEIDDDDAR